MLSQNYQSQIFQGKLVRASDRELFNTIAKKFRKKQTSQNKADFDGWENLQEKIVKFQEAGAKKYAESKGLSYVSYESDESE